jgi:hypothetical protein
LKIIIFEIDLHMIYTWFIFDFYLILF